MHDNGECYAPHRLDCITQVFFVYLVGHNPGTQKADYASSAGAAVGLAGFILPNPRNHVPL